MPSKFSRKGTIAHPSDLSASSLTLPGTAGTAPDIGLSAAFRGVLGRQSGEAHPAAPALKQGQEIARLARSTKSAQPAKGAKGKANIGPRSGHK
jgi:hypothetical protein